MKNLKKNVVISLLFMAILSLSLFAFGCKVKTATIHFETNGASGYDNVKVDIGVEYVLPEAPSRGEEYSFEGWYLESDFSGSAVTSVTPSADMTVYAKWEQKYAVNLDAQGGQLSTTKVYLKQGENVYEAVSGLAPTKSGYQFGAWYNGKTQVGQNTRMPAKELTLTAVYKAPYTIKLYTQNETLDGYNEEVIEGFEYEGNEISVEANKQGFSLVTKENSKHSLVMQATNNELVAYYDRNAVTITFLANFEGSTETAKVETYYGVQTTFPDNSYFEREGFYLKGWATQADGELVYESNYLDRVVYGAQEIPANDSIVPERTMVLYAVWEKGYYDMFGGDDYIFVELDGENPNVGTAYLNRGSYFFKGRYYPNGELQNFRFDIDPDNSVILAGKLNDNGTFVYLDDSRQDYSSTLLDWKQRKIIEGETIEFDSANGITYYKQNIVTGEGTYVVNDEGIFEITFTGGEMAGTSMQILIGTSNGTPVFIVRDMADVELGKLTRFATYQGSVVSYRTYFIELDGFGNALFYNDLEDETKYETLAYTREGDIITIKEGNSSLTVKMLTVGDVLGYALYDAQLDQTIVNEDGTKLTLDGIYNLTYFDGTTEYTGYYTTQSSVFGGIIVNTTINQNPEKFLINVQTTTNEVAGGQTETVTTYSFEQKLATYAEYYYKDSANIYYAPLIVIDENGEGTVTIYGFTTARTFEKVSEGTYKVKEVINEGTGLSIYQIDVTTYVDPAPEVSTSLYDLTQVKQIICALDSTSTDYSVSYWYQVTKLDDTVETYDKMYTDETGATLVLVGGMAIYSSQGQVVVGEYQVSNGLTVLSTSNGNLYFEVATESTKFIKLDHAPYNVYAYNEDGTQNANEYIALDGKGGAVYTVITTTVDETTGEEVQNVEEVVGTVTQTDFTNDYNSYIYTFSSATVNFKYIQLYTSQNAFFAKYNYDDETCSGVEYTSDVYGILKLDGFGFYATYTTVEGEVYQGRYSLVGATAYGTGVRMITDYGYRYFDVNGTTFTARGLEYAGSETSAYIVFDNQRMNGQYVYFDGYGKATVFTMTTPDGETEAVRTYIDENATYQINGDVITISFVDGTDQLKYVGKTSLFVYNDYYLNAFELIREDSIVKAYVEGSDWTVLILNDVGKAIRYKDLGVKETGTYKLITESLIYYANDEGTDACLYYFDPATQTITLCETLSYNYYTEDLNTLLFTKYGFVIKNNELAFYYTIENGNATIYRYDAENVNANAYGFVEESFGTFQDVITFDGATYYKYDGYDIKFERVAENVGKYAINGEQITSVSFTPVGGETYSVRATITVGDKQLDGGVVKDANGLHLVILDGAGQYQFDLAVTYKGAGNAFYTLSSMEHYAVYYAYSWAQSYIMYYIMFGIQLPNTIGVLQVSQIYDETGAVVEDYINASFGEDSGCFDSLGNLLTMDKVAYTYNETTQVYTVSVNMADGYTYEFQFITADVMGISCYRLLGFVRVQTLTVGTEYSLVVKRVIASDYANPGAIFDVELSVNGTFVDYTQAYLVEGAIVYIVRTLDENNLVTSSVHYTINLVEKADEGVETDTVKAYESATIEKTENTIHYNLAKDQFVEMSGGKVVTIVAQTAGADGPTYATLIARSCEVQQDGSYLVTVVGDKKYTVTITDGVASITEVKEETQA